MKKILVSLLVLALCAPAMAATVGAVTSPGQAVITVTAENGVFNIVGMGLDVDIVSGTVDGCTVDTATFNIFPDAAHDLEIATPGSYTYGAGTPIALQDGPGETTTAASFAVSVGALNGAAIPGATGSASVQLTITAAAGATVDISENALRGGIVLTDGNGEDITSGTAGVVTVVIPAGGPLPCYDRLTATEQTEWNEYITAGRTAAELEPWCWQFQCYGDASNTTETLSKYRVYNADLTLLLANWKLKAATANPAADFDHKDETLSKYKVYNGDLTILLANWKAKDTALVPNCPGYVAP